MPLEAGRKLGPYEIVEPIGKGGMGEVYRARDTKLDRDVAIKVLPDDLAADEERVARFEREAKLLASLNHPNIASIYGFEESPQPARSSLPAEGEAVRVGPRGTIRCLVLELVEGPTLAERIEQGPIPIDEAVAIAKQIAEALEAGHEAGVIHRDLKPANIKLKEDGTVKVLDYGLAKALEGEAATTGDSELSQSPTRLRQGFGEAGATGVGVILGTAAYMSPEQAKGKRVDKRADIWAFGAVLFEMLTGAGAFAGDDVSTTLAHVLTKEIDWMALPAATPPDLRRLLRRCLERERKLRLRDIGDARLELVEIVASPAAEPGSTPALPAQAETHRARWAWAVAAGALAGAVGMWSVERFQTEQLPTAMRFTIPVSAGYGISEISPDGTQLAYVDALAGTGRGNLSLRQLDSTASRPLANLSASDIAWSPDSRHLAISRAGRLIKVAVQNEQAQVLLDPLVSADVQQTRGITWSGDRIVFSVGSGPLYQVSASGGESTSVTALDDVQNELAHLWPQFLPDDRHFIFLVQSRTPENTGIYVGSLDSPEKHLLVRTDVKAAFARPGYLLFVRGDTLLAQKMDMRALRLTGEPSPVTNGVGSFSTYGQASFSASDTGVLVHSRSWNAPRELRWFDREGTLLDRVGESVPGATVNLSPDERGVATTRATAADAGDGNIWLTDLERNVASPFTSSRALDVDPQWAPNGRQIAFSSDRNGRSALFLKSLEGTPTELLHASDDSIFMSDWSNDGRYMLYHQTNATFFALPRFGDRKPILVLDTPSTKDQGQFSPNTKWIAYNARNSDRFEIYVTPFPKGGEEIRVSREGGVQPRWRADGRELFFLDPEGRMMSVSVRDTEDRIEFGMPRPLFQSSVEPIFSTELYDVTGDGERFIMMVRVETDVLTSLADVVVNWPSLLRE